METDEAEHRGTVSYGLSPERPNAAGESPPASSPVPGGAVASMRSAVVLVVVAGLVLFVGLRLGRRAIVPVDPTSAAPAASRGQVDAPVSAGMPAERVDGPSSLPAGPIEHLEVAYFHRTHRCSACLNAERLTRATLERRFADRVARGEIGLVVEDTEAPADPSLVRRYDAWGSALYLGATVGGVLYTWPVSEIWLVVNEDDRFVDLLDRRIREALGQG